MRFIEYEKYIHIFFSDWYERVELLLTAINFFYKNSVKIFHCNLAMIVSTRNPNYILKKKF